MPFFARTALLWLTILASRSAPGQTVTFSDGEFAPADWELIVLTNGNGGSSSAAQQSSGGNPSAYRRVDVSLAAATVSNPSRVYAFHGRRSAVYDPKTGGAIAAIDYSEDVLAISA